MALPKKKATAILKEFFGLLPGQTLAQFAAELKALRESGQENYREVVTLAAEELGVEPEFAS